jgi:hypothetical protein
MIYALVAYYSDRSSARIVALYDNYPDVERIWAVAGHLGTHETLAVIQGKPGQVLTDEEGRIFQDPPRGPVA